MNGGLRCVKLGKRIARKTLILTDERISPDCCRAVLLKRQRISKLRSVPSGGGVARGLPIGAICEFRHRCLDYHEHWKRDVWRHKRPPPPPLHVKFLNIRVRIWCGRSDAHRQSATQNFDPRVQVTPMPDTCRARHGIGR